jgi:hypothetical protein
VLIEPAQEAPDCPFLPIDSSLYMPKVHSSLEWADINRQEEAFRRYRELHGIAEVPLVPKCRCQLCKIFIGQGYMESEIYAHWGRPEWDEPRWTNEVVMICGGCARKRLSRDKDILSKLDTLTEAWLEKHGPSDKQSVFLETRTLLLRTHEAQLMERYATKYRLVNSQEIGKISWLEIEKRRKAFQEKHNVRPEDPHSPTIRHAAKPGAAVLRRPGGANGVADFPGAGDIDTTEAVW